MTYLKIKIDVNNPDEVIAYQKGQILGVASKLLGKEKKKESEGRKNRRKRKTKLHHYYISLLFSGIICSRVHPCYH